MRMLFLLLTLTATAFSADKICPLIKLSKGFDSLPYSQQVEVAHELFDLNTPPQTAKEGIVTIVQTEKGLDTLAQIANGYKVFYQAPKTPEKKRVVFAGTGVHATTAVSNFVRRDTNKANKVIMLDAGDRVSKNFAGEKPFRINSGKPNFVQPNAQPNAFPGAVLSPEEVGYFKDDRNAYPVAGLLAKTASISRAAQGVDLYYNQTVRSLDFGQAKPGELRPIEVSTQQGKFLGDFVVLSMGVSKPKISGIQGMEKILEEERINASGDRDYNLYQPRVEVYTDLLARIPREGGRVFELLNNKEVAVIGAQHGGNVTVEALIAGTPEMKDFENRGPRHIGWWGQTAKNGNDFLQKQKPGGGDDPRQLFHERYARYGIPEAINSERIGGIDARVTGVERVGNKVRVIGTTRSGQQIQRDYDAVYLASGFESPALEVLNNSFGATSEATRTGVIAPLKSNLIFSTAPPGSGFSAALPSETIASVYEQPSGGSRNQVFMIGPGVGIDVNPQRTRDSVTGSPESINVLAPLSAEFGRWLRVNYQ